MSQPRLHQKLMELFEQRDPNLLLECLNHDDFVRFLEAHKLTLPKAELVVAFTHTSFSHEYSVAHQELLEFLGDSVLQLILTHELYQRFPGETEGRLSKMRSTLVNEKSLATVAQKLGISELLLVGKGEYKKQLHHHEAVLADTMEALLAQIYRHQGFEATRSFFLRWLEAALPEAWKTENFDLFDPKSALQEKTLALYKKLPQYTSEPEGDKFLVKLWINDELAASGIFPSKKGGEKELASTVIKKGIL